ncbi:MAG TPA: hypothetical protein VFU11_10245 [Solirubrobacterales bacterium]|nr:hypothetical protein [Solirubrobacterales bacterium]
MSDTAAQIEKSEQDAEAKQQEGSRAPAGAESEQARPSKSATAGKKSKVKSKKAKSKAAQAKPKSSSASSSADGKSTSPRLKAGELDGLVLGYMKKHPDKLPISPGGIAKEIKRSSGAIGNCLERLKRQKEVRRVEDKPKKYDLPKAK